MSQKKRITIVVEDIEQHRSIAELAVSDHFDSNYAVDRGLSPYLLDEVIEPVVSFKKEWKAVTDVSFVKLADIFEFCLIPGVAESIVSYINEKEDAAQATATVS